MTRLVAALALSGLAGNEATTPQPDATDLGPLERAEIYTFVLPAIDCYRTTDIDITTDEVALNHMLSSAFEDLDEGEEEALKQAAVTGAVLFESVVSGHGKQSYCEFVRDHFGPAGSIAKNLAKPLK